MDMIPRKRTKKNEVCFRGISMSISARTRTETREAASHLSIPPEIEHLDRAN